MPIAGGCQSYVQGAGLGLCLGEAQTTPVEGRRVAGFAERRQRGAEQTTGLAGPPFRAKEHLLRVRLGLSPRRTAGGISHLTLPGIIMGDTPSITVTTANTNTTGRIFLGHDLRWHFSFAVGSFMLVASTISRMTVEMRVDEKWYKSMSFGRIRISFYSISVSKLRGRCNRWHYVSYISRQPPSADRLTRASLDAETRLGPAQPIWHFVTLHPAIRPYSSQLNDHRNLHRPSTCLRATYANQSQHAHTTNKSGFT